MAVWGQILIVIGLMSLIEGFIVVIFPKWTKAAAISLVKSEGKLIKLGWFEVLVAAILILIGMNI